MTSIRFTADNAGRNSFVIAIRNDGPILARIRHFRQHDAISPRLDKMPQSSKNGRRQGEIRFMPFVVVVEFHLKQGARSQFRRLIDANADASVRSEPGCVQFDVLEPEDDGDRVLLYEIYSDEAAFDAHRQTEHFRTFASQSETLCLKKSVTRCRLAFSGADVVSQRL
jgi:quinol monooxygenase YgiN